MKNNTVSTRRIEASGGNTPAPAVKGYRIERRYEGERTAAQVVSALIKVHDHAGAA